MLDKVSGDAVKTRSRIRVPGRRGTWNTGPGDRSR